MKKTHVAAITTSMMLLMTVGQSFASSIDPPEPVPPFLAIGNVSGETCLIPGTGEKVEAKITKNKPGVLECKGELSDVDKRKDRGHPEHKKSPFFCIRILDDGSQDTAKSWIMHVKDGNARLHCHF